MCCYISIIYNKDLVTVLNSRKSVCYYDQGLPCYQFCDRILQNCNMTACSGKEAEPETEEPTEPPKEKGNTGGLMFFLVVALLGGGGALYYFKFMKPKQSVKGDTDLEDFDFDDYDEDEGDGLSDEEQEDEEA